jgi:putative hemolysin
MQSRTTILLILGLCLAAGIFVAGCTRQPAPAQPPATAGMANPASVNCVNIGGTVEIKKDASGGEYGMCRFQNGTSCEEWALFRGEGCKPGIEPSATATVIGMPNPAAVYCGQVGGTSKTLKNPDGSEYGMCVFANGTSCDEWALFRSEGCKSGGQAASK